MITCDCLSDPPSNPTHIISNKHTNKKIKMGFIDSMFSSSGSGRDQNYSSLSQCTSVTSISMNIPIKSFKERNSFTERVAAVENIREKFPSKVPVIVERFRKVQSRTFKNVFIL